MALSLHPEGMQLRSAFDRICEEIYCLVELNDREESNIDFRHGKTVSETDRKMMKISYADSASKEFWKPYDKNANLEEELDGHEEMVAEIEEKHNGETKTIGDADLLSLRYSHFLYFCVARAALNNPIFDGTEGSYRFEKIW